MKFWIDKGGFIYLFQILKAAGAIQEYREVSLAIKHGQVSVNDETCFKQRRVLKVDDTVRYKKLHIKVMERDELGRTDEEAMRGKQPDGTVKHGDVKGWGFKPLKKDIDVDIELEEISRRVHEMLVQNNLKLAMAESCTGGMIQNLITSHAGSSKYFVGGLICYSDEIKNKILKVKKETLKKHGAVSKETALEMASNAAKLFAADIAGSVTGIAGPDGGTEEKPVGTVHIAVKFIDNLLHQNFVFRGNRDSVRKKSSLQLFKLILENLS
ncbi:MAG: hypothetical protein DRI23_06520 [Candidatus Cloacimonadota bacterium]|nr:MAG: hypothetical protein DRI23_06520 [Candidatus Cloacimonadota bacterium]RLC51626.1 MAG: hypothetical protein DRH79_05930 [Candidatus Cloacimonadota bacterium]